MCSAVQLRSQGLVRGKYQCRALHGLNHVRHRECLARTGHAQQRLPRQTALQPVDERSDGRWLVPGWFEIGDELESIHK